MLKKLIFGIAFLSVVFSCSQPQREDVDFEAWGRYWFQGKAEISSFDLTQYRYGEAREGEAVLVFVTEDFSRSNQVKLDNPDQAGRDKQSVIKMNQTRDFVTGIYPYHMMLSAFTPTKEQSNGVKFTMSSQEWCGQSFVQLNLKSGDSYSGKIFSYFEKEGDDSFSFSGLSEDDLWNLIRINPNQIPTGSVSMMPSLFYQRFTHKGFEAQEAFVRVRDISNNRSQVEVTYSNGNRVLKVDFEKEFPYQIMAWEEEDTRSDGSKEVTKASRKGLKVVDYWTRNKVEDEFLRKELNLKN
ncbi:hypothetical protein [Arthrospiribacter ruber]|uniref:Septum formation inhibitor Maf n=1 Tax=Arthrospiribacter ruber TaxID=2487934 RepID=A0A951MF71_9BACT|nr:hypothetical protein [Arthrospiribacter ruber]MBW3469692.1 hypothetical protein [Arthrospiribacter ruber]